MKLRHLITSALALILMSACTDGLVDVNVDEIVGTWNATSMVFTSDTDSDVFVDLIAEGATLTVVLSAEGTYSLLITEFEGQPVDEGGTYSVDGAILSLDPIEFEENDSFEAVLNGNMVMEEVVESKQVLEEQVEQLIHSLHLEQLRQQC